MKKPGLSRREFLETTAVTLVGAAALTSGCGKGEDAGGSASTNEPSGGVPSAPPPADGVRASEPAPVAEPPPEPGPGRSRVVLIRDQAVFDDKRRIDAAVLAGMVDQGVAALLGEKDPAAAWGRLIRPDDVVGIKTNQWRFLHTPKELEAMLRARVEAAGVAADRISVRDRGVLDDPIFQKSTALLNARPMRTHHWAGVGTCIKNYILFHPKPSDWHGDSCANLAGVWDLPIVKGKTRLNILVMLHPLFHGKGPHHYQAEYTWNYKGLIVGQDPVAVDATGLRIIEAQRRRHFGKDEPLATPVTHLEVAEEKYHLGVADPEKIEVVKLGWTDDILI